ncbi:MAG TPA: hypothetical protein VEV16_11305 [Daejeonella sp.]|nr:hypothetical protein [Daejeonella sp.]
MLFILIALLALILQFFLPWWIIALVAFGLAFWKARSGGHAFGHGFLAILALWIIIGLIQSFPNEHLLANRVGQMLMLPNASWSWILVLFITGIIGGLAAGFSAMAGFYCRRAMVKS